MTEACTRALETFVGPPDLALVFFSPHHAEAADQIVALARERLAPKCLLGCSGESIVGNDHEIEQQPALSLWLGRWKEPVQLTSFHLALEQTPDGYSLMGWPDELAGANPAEAVVFLLGDPYTFPADVFLNQVNETQRGLRVVGGMASGARGAGESRLILNDKVLQEGAAGVLVQGPIQVRTVVSQGCRPIGRHLVITKGRDNIIEGLGGKPPLAHLQQLWQELTPEDQQLFQQGLHVGGVINDYLG
jgi:small ligand-binding sensory domain FIST